MKAIYVLLAATLASILATAINAFAVAGHVASSASAAPQSASLARSPLRGAVRSLAEAGTWLGSSPLGQAELRGKVVLVDFGTYSCINWIRTLPHVREWADKYRQQGLVVISVHTPEFEFEKDAGNVRRALQAMAIRHPVVLDNDYVIWDAFGNRAWPALYVIDAQGRVRHHQSGEGGYEKAEKVIQSLLLAAGATGASENLASPVGRGVETAADWKNLRSPEIYLGHARTDNFASSGGAAAGVPRSYALPSRLMLNSWALSGQWTFHEQFTALGRADGRIAVRFHARDVHLVMGPAVPGARIRFQVLIDGQPPRGDHGLDVDEQGHGTIVEPRLYQLVRQHSPVRERQVEIRFLDAGVEAYSFTFG